jgi:hypothetical protein
MMMTAIHRAIQKSRVDIFIKVNLVSKEGILHEKDCQADDSLMLYPEINQNKSIGANNPSKLETFVSYLR